MYITESGKRLVTVIKGDGIGPEVVGAAMQIVEAAGAKVAWEEAEAGAAVFKRGLPSGVPDATIESIRKTRVVLKGPLETPVGFGEKSANVTLRKLFETYGNIRPVRDLPGVKTPYAGRGIDLVIVRENVEDLYAGIEHMQTPGVAQCLKLISRKGCEKVVRLAFEFARSEGRESVACATKANIMKLSEGMLKRTFEEIAPEYPDIEASHVIVDNCAHLLVKRPEQFDVIVTTNMNGDILSDLTSALVGGLGFAPGANIGNEVAIFEAVHGTAPRCAGLDVANPTAVILSATMLLRHIGEFAAASAVEHAVLVTLEQGKQTKDAVEDGQPSVGTTAFTDAVIANLGKKSEKWAVRDSKPLQLPRLSQDPVAPATVPAARRTMGADIFLESPLLPAALGPLLEEMAEGSALKLKMISNRGTRVYPATGAITDNVDHYRCRFVLRQPSAPDADLCDGDVLDLLNKMGKGGHRWVHVEKLQEFDGKPAYTRAQGED